MKHYTDAFTKDAYMFIKVYATIHSECALSGSSIYMYSLSSANILDANILYSIVLYNFLVCRCRVELHQSCRCRITMQHTIYTAHTSRETRSI